MTDEFYTKHPEQFVDIINDYLQDVENPFLVEPSCGDGAFLNVLTFNLCFDIVKHVEHEYFILKDFLTTTNEDIPTDAVFIGNPPFGRNSSLAVKFCNHCCNLNARYIMFILPAVFNNEKYKQKAFMNNYELFESFEYNEFVQNGKNVKVETVFQIWHRNDEIKPIIKPKDVKIKPKYFKYINRKTVLSDDFKPNDRIFSIRRVGSTTPELTLGVHESLEDHFIIELNENVNISSFIEKYNEHEFDISPSTKQKHINQNDLNKQVNKLDVELSNSKISYNPVNMEEENKLNDMTMKTIISSESYKCKLLELKTHIEELSKVKIDENDLLNDDYFSSLIIKPQSKAIIRGNLFNSEVYSSFVSIMPEGSIIEREFKHPDFAEILDLYVKYNDKELFIFNQIDLWNGGEQLNKCDKYLSNPKPGLLCIVLHEPNITCKSKVHKLITTNLNKHIIWFSDIHEFVKSYFDHV